MTLTFPVIERLSPSARGIACMLFGTCLLTSQDAITKWLTAGHHPGEIMFWRTVLALPALATIVWLAGGTGQLRSRAPRANLLRGLFGLAASICVVASFTFLPLAEALAIIFINPLLLVALSGPLLGERVGRQRWLAVLAGFAGVLLIVRPGGGSFGWYVLLPLGGALFSALRDIVTRRLGGHDSSTTVLVWTMVIAGLGSAPSLAWRPHGLGPAEVGLLLCAGTLLTLAQWFTIRALHLAESATVAPFKYLSLVWAGVLGFLVWGDVPGPWKIAGACLVVASSLYVMRLPAGPPVVHRSAA